MTGIDPPPRAVRSRWGIVALLALVLAFDLTGLGWGLPHSVAPHVDDAAKPALDALRHGFLNQTKYPKVHLALLGAAYAPYLGGLYLSGGLRLSGTSLAAADASVFSDPAHALSVLLLIARGVTVALHLGSVLLLYRAARRLVARGEAALLGAALWGLAPVVALYARSSNVDVPMCFWLAAITLQFLRVVERPTRGRLVALALLAVAGVGTKEQVAFALLPFAIAVPLLVWRRRRDDRRRALADLGSAGLLALLAYALSSGLLLDPAQWAARQAAWRADLAGFVDITAAHVTATDLVRAWLRDLVLVGSPALALAWFVSLASLMVGRRRAGLGWLGLALSYALLLTGWLGFEQPRYVMPAALFGCLFVACRADAVLAALANGATGARRVRLARVCGALLLLAAAGHAAQVGWALTDDSRRLAQAWIASHVPPGTVVETYQDPNHLPGLEALGMAPAQSRDMSLDGVARRAPAAIVVSADEGWRWSAAQKRFVAALFEGLPGYSIARFGPRYGSRAPLWVDPTSPDRCWPDIAVLVRAP